MSGTSLDGLDLCLVDLRLEKNRWSFEINEALTVSYSDSLIADLRNATKMEAAALQTLDLQIGKLIGEAVHQHFGQHAAIDFIASHGHTIFHQPQKGVSLQIGNAQAIYENSGLPVISDFRSLDVALGGNGAPLVPIGDQLLFDAYDCFLNLGGIANCTFYQKHKVLAYDLMPFNMVLNKLANQLGHTYDDGGAISRSGHLDEKLFQALQHINFYQVKPPKSLGIEDFEREWFPLFEKSASATQDQMHTYVHHAARLIGSALNVEAKPHSKLLVTGGGAYHQFFIELLQEHFIGQVVIPSKETVEFKEALIFALLGTLKLEGKANCLGSVTGAKQDSSGGVLTGFSQSKFV